MYQRLPWTERVRQSQLPGELDYYVNAIGGNVKCQRDMCRQRKHTFNPAATALLKIR